MVAKITFSPLFWSSISIARASLVVGYYIEMFFFPFLVDNDDFFSKMATPPLMPTDLSFLHNLEDEIYVLA